MINSVVLTGRLTRDPELRYTPNSNPVTRFTIAVDRRGKGPNGEKQTDFIRCSCWNKTAELAANYLHKGSLIGVEGSLRVNVVNNPDGTRREYVEVLINNFTFLDSRREGAPANAEENDFAGFGEVLPAATPTRPRALREEEDDDIPF